MTRRMLGFVVASLIAIAATAQAGEKVTQEVYIDYKNHVAGGSLGSARNSADYRQKIGCSVFATAGSGNYVSCAAKDEDGNWAGCMSDDPALVDAGIAVSGDSSLFFYWDDTGNCTQLGATNTSSTEPKQP